MIKPNLYFYRISDKNGVRITQTVIVQSAELEIFSQELSGVGKQF